MSTMTFPQLELFFDWGQYIKWNPLLRFAQLSRWKWSWESRSNLNIQDHIWTIARQTLYSPWQSFLSVQMLHFICANTSTLAKGYTFLNKLSEFCWELPLTSNRIMGQNWFIEDWKLISVSLKFNKKLMLYFSVSILQPEFLKKNILV